MITIIMAVYICLQIPVVIDLYMFVITQIYISISETPMMTVNKKVDNFINF